jgi:hypothetical protein
MTTVPTHRSRHWQLPNGRAAISQARRAIENALRDWGLSHTADEVADHVAPLIHQLNATSRGSLELRLELRRSARLLLGEISRTNPAPPVPGSNSPAGKSVRGIVAITYGRRAGRDGTAGRYTHAFIWPRPNETSAAHQPGELRHIRPA